MKLTFKIMLISGLSSLLVAVGSLAASTNKIGALRSNLEKREENSLALLATPSSRAHLSGALGRLASTTNSTATKHLNTINTRQHNDDDNDDDDEQQHDRPLLKSANRIHKSNLNNNNNLIAQQQGDLLNPTYKMMAMFVNPIAEALVSTSSLMTTESSHLNQPEAITLSNDNNSTISSIIFASDILNRHEQANAPTSNSTSSSYMLPFNMTAARTSTTSSMTARNSTQQSSHESQTTANSNGFNGTDPYAFTTESRSFLLPVEVQIIMCLFYGTLAFTAVTSNMIVCYIVLSNQRMRTATNYFIVNLAVGDILMALLCIPFTFPANIIFQYWPFGLSLCVIVSYSQANSVFISAYTMVAISIDKYLAIVYPMRLRMPKIQAKVIILVIWSAALMTSLPTALLSSLTLAYPDSTATTPTTTMNAPTSPSHTLLYPSSQTTNNSISGPQSSSSTPTSLGTLGPDNSRLEANNITSIATAAPAAAQTTQPQQPQQQEQKKYFCQESWSFWPAGKYYYSMALMILQFVLPLFVLVITYSRIVIIVWGKRMPGEEDNARDARMARSKRKMIKMVIFCMIAFALTWLPFNVLMVIGDLYPDIWEHQQIMYIWTITHYLAMCHTITNPLIYIWMNNRFRSGFKQYSRISMAFTLKHQNTLGVTSSGSLNLNQNTTATYYNNHTATTFGAGHSHSGGSGAGGESIKRTRSKSPFNFEASNERATGVRSLLPAQNNNNNRPAASDEQAADTLTAVTPSANPGGRGAGPIQVLLPQDDRKEAPHQVDRHPAGSGPRTAKGQVEEASGGGSGSRNNNRAPPPGGARSVSRDCSSGAALRLPGEAAEQSSQQVQAEGRRLSRGPHGAPAWPPSGEADLEPSVCLPCKPDAAAACATMPNERAQATTPGPPNHEPPKSAASDGLKKRRRKRGSHVIRIQMTSTLGRTLASSSRDHSAPSSALERLAREGRAQAQACEHRGKAADSALDQHRPAGRKGRWLRKQQVVSAAGPCAQCQAAAAAAAAAALRPQRPSTGGDGSGQFLAELMNVRETGQIFTDMNPSSQSTISAQTNLTSLAMSPLSSLRAGHASTSISSSSALEGRGRGNEQQAPPTGPAEWAAGMGVAPSGSKAVAARGWSQQDLVASQRRPRPLQLETASTLSSSFGTAATSQSDPGRNHHHRKHRRQASAGSSRTGADQVASYALGRHQQPAEDGGVETEDDACDHIFVQAPISGANCDCQNVGGHRRGSTGILILQARAAPVSVSLQDRRQQEQRRASTSKSSGSLEMLSDQFDQADEDDDADVAGQRGQEEEEEDEEEVDEEQGSEEEEESLEAEYGEKWPERRRLSNEFEMVKLARCARAQSDAKREREKSLEEVSGQVVYAQQADIAQQLGHFGAAAPNANECASNWRPQTNERPVSPPATLEGQRHLGGKRLAQDHHHRPVQQQQPAVAGLALTNISPSAVQAGRSLRHAMLLNNHLLLSSNKVQNGLSGSTNDVRDPLNRSQESACVHLQPLKRQQQAAERTISGAYQAARGHRRAAALSAGSPESGPRQQPESPVNLPHLPGVATWSGKQVLLGGCRQNYLFRPVACADGQDSAQSASILCAARGSRRERPPQSETANQSSSAPASMTSPSGVSHSGSLTERHQAQQQQQRRRRPVEAAAHPKPAPIESKTERTNLTGSLQNGINQATLLGEKAKFSCSAELAFPHSSMRVPLGACAGQSAQTLTANQVSEAMRAEVGSRLIEQLTNERESLLSGSKGSAAGSDELTGSGSLLLRKSPTVYLINRSQAIQRRQVASAAAPAGGSQSAAAGSLV